MIDCVVASFGVRCVSMLCPCVGVSVCWCVSVCFERKVIVSVEIEVSVGVGNSVCTRALVSAIALGSVLVPTSTIISLLGCVVLTFAVIFLIQDWGTNSK